MEVTKNKGYTVEPLKTFEPGKLAMETYSNIVAIKCPKISKMTEGSRPIEKLPTQIATEFEHAFRVPHKVYAINEALTKTTGLKAGDYVYIRPELFAFKRTGAGWLMFYNEDGYKEIQLIMLDFHYVAGRANNKEYWDKIHAHPLTIKTKGTLTE